MLDDIPEDIVDAIATEEDATDLDSLKTFMTEKNHPAIAELKKKEEAKEAEEAKKKKAVSAAAVPEVVAGMPVAGMLSGFGSGGGGGIKIVLKNAKITIDQVIVKHEEE